MNILSTFSAEASEWFDTLMLVGFLLFAFVTGYRISKRAYIEACMSAGLASVALAWLML